jgi:hypothetical protein
MDRVGSAARKFNRDASACSIFPSSNGEEGGAELGPERVRSLSVMEYWQQESKTEDFPHED